ncbi:hypothetical protein [Ensifer adhaerens]|uniref:hypothetical protein n=1 Tax=Ensifer adhaerens TaxID=106592 RepID=UPI001319F0B5|nr:hypothetical protein [Ensifer adhaerens]
MSDELHNLAFPLNTATDADHASIEHAVKRLGRLRALLWPSSNELVSSSARVEQSFRPRLRQQPVNVGDIVA